MASPVWPQYTLAHAISQGELRTDFQIQAQTFGDRTICDPDGLKVTALHNLHLPRLHEDQPWRSFSFRIEADGWSVVFSGDVKSIPDIAPLIDGCDLLLMETGHHKVEDICAWLKAGIPVT